MIALLKVGLRIIAVLTISVILLGLATAVGLPALIGYYIFLGGYFLYQKTNENSFLSLLCLPIFLTSLAIGHVFFIPLIIVSPPIACYFLLEEFLIGRRLRKSYLANQATETI